MIPACEHRWAEAEALKGAQQVEAVVLGFSFRINHLRQLVGERHFPSNSPQVVCVLGVLNHDGNIEEKEVEGYTSYIRNTFSSMNGTKLPVSHTHSV